MMLNSAVESADPTYQPEKVIGAQTSLGLDNPVPINVNSEDPANWDWNKFKLETGDTTLSQFEYGLLKGAETSVAQTNAAPLLMNSIKGGASFSDIISGFQAKAAMDDPNNDPSKFGGLDAAVTGIPDLGGDGSATAGGSSGTGIPDLGGDGSSVASNAASTTPNEDPKTYTERIDQALQDLAKMGVTQPDSKQVMDAMKHRLDLGTQASQIQTPVMGHSQPTDANLILSSALNLLGGNAGGRFSGDIANAPYAAAKAEDQRKYAADMQGYQGQVANMQRQIQAADNEVANAKWTYGEDSKHAIEQYKEARQNKEDQIKGLQGLQKDFEGQVGRLQKDITDHLKTKGSWDSASDDPGVVSAINAIHDAHPTYSTQQIAAMLHVPQDGEKTAVQGNKVVAQEDARTKASGLLALKGDQLVNKILDQYGRGDINEQAARAQLAQHPNLSSNDVDTIMAGAKSVRTQLLDTQAKLANQKFEENKKTFPDRWQAIKDRNHLSIAQQQHILEETRELPIKLGMEQTKVGIAIESLQNTLDNGAQSRASRDASTNLALIKAQRSNVLSQLSSLKAQYFNPETKTTDYEAYSNDPKYGPLVKQLGTLSKGLTDLQSKYKDAPMTGATVNMGELKAAGESAVGNHKGKPSCGYFVTGALKASGVNIPIQGGADNIRTYLFQHGGKEVTKDQAQSGDVVWYYGKGYGAQLDSLGNGYHVAIYNGDGTVTDSSSGTTRTNKPLQAGARFVRPVRSGSATSNANSAPQSSRDQPHTYWDPNLKEMIAPDDARFDPAKQAQHFKTPQKDQSPGAKAGMSAGNAAGSNTASAKPSRAPSKSGPSKTRSGNGFH